MPEKSRRFPSPELFRKSRVSSMLPSSPAAFCASQLNTVILGATLYCLGRTDEAINHLQEAIRLNPEHSMAHFSLANALLQKDRLHEAMEHYRAALQLNPRYGEAQCNLALALVKQGEREEATGQFQRALARSEERRVGK